jgi:toxin CcdB
VYANPLDIATVAFSRLGEVLEILADRDQDRIIRCIDEMVSRA